MNWLRNKFVRGVLIGLVAAFAAVGMWSCGWFDFLEGPVWDWRVRLFARHETFSPRIKVILIDQASLEWGQRENGWGWPWPREVYVAIGGFCERGGARAFAADLIFTEPSVYGVDDDRMFGEALRGLDMPTILGLVPGGSVSRWPDGFLKTWRGVGEVPAVAVTTILFPVGEIGREMALGHVTGTADADGVFRSVAPFVGFDGTGIPALGLAAWLAGDEAAGVGVAGDGRLEFGVASCRIDRRKRVVLRFRGDGGGGDAVSAAAVIQSELSIREGRAPVLPPEMFKDAYVFLGCSAPALLDLRPTPVNPKAPGVTLHTTFLDNLLTDSFIAPVPFWLVVGVVVLACVGASLSLTYLGAWWQMVLAALGWLAVAPAGGALAYAGGWWWPVVAHEAGLGLAVCGALFAGYLVEGRQKAFIKQAFRHYLSGDVIERILRDPGHLTLGGEKRELTIIFTDLAGFSTFSEKLTPSELTALLNEYLSEMTDIIMEEGGTLDKYEGDAIIAFWNAPLEQTDHAERACRAAVRCQKRLAEIRDELRRRTGAELRMRVGINTGEVVVGNMGSRKRFNYTILGDAANLASRLEGANKAFGTETMVAAATWRQVSPGFTARKLADLRVVGRAQPVTVYELTDFCPPGQPAAAPGSFAEGLAAFAAGEFAAAAACFETLPGDPAARAYAERCRRLAAAPPARWDGVWAMEGK